MYAMLPARIALFTLLAQLSLLASAATCYVNTAAPGGNGTSWAAAYTDLQLALTNAACTPIWVARGTYKPTATADRTISFNIRPGVAVYGGFAGTEAALTDRVTAVNPTILSGDIGVAGDNSDNSYHVVALDGTIPFEFITPGTILADLTISDGNANGAGANQSFGGGLYCNGSGAGHLCSPQLARVIFENNSAQAGGAMYNDGSSGGASSPLIHDVIVRNNQAPGGAGGGVYNGGGGGGTASPQIEHVTFTGNSADLGGAIYNNGIAGNASPTVTNSTFYANTASTGGAMLNYGPSAGIASPLLRYVTFSGNKATSSGGAIFSIAPTGDATPNMSGVIFWADEPNETDPPAAASSIEFSISPECPSFANGCLHIDPLLGPLQYNGGFAPTLRPQIGSLAINNGDAGKCPSDDERGVSRPQGSACDIGAVEVTLSEQKLCLVNAAAGPTNNGKTWATAYLSPTSALADASCSEVWVAKGTYKPTSGVDRSVSFVLSPGKAVYGGFAGTETLRSQRNPTVNPTILSGEIAAPAFKDDNSYHVVVADADAAAADITNATVLDGFTITGGYANLNVAGSIDSVGGGLVCNAQNGHICSPTLANLVFSANYATTGGAVGLIAEGGISSPSLTSVAFTGNSGNEGGALYIDAFEGVANPTVSASQFVGNSASDGGGAIFDVDGDGSFSVAGTTFDGNNADSGGAVFLGTGGSFTDVVFTGNQAATSGGAVYDAEGGDFPRSPTFTRVTFRDNQAADHGGAVYSTSGSAAAPSYNTVTFIGNAAPFGGAVAAYGGNASFNDVLFARNGGAGAFRGGALLIEASYAAEASPVVDRATFVANAAGEGAAVCIVASEENAHPVIRNATFTKNSGGNGGASDIVAGNGYAGTAAFNNVTFAFNPTVNGGDAIFLDNGSGNASATVSNSILYSGTLPSNGQVYLEPGTVISIDHSLVTFGCPAGATCTTVSSADPLLGLFQYYGGFTPTLMPAVGSPALDAGVNCTAVDQRGIARPQGAACDIGAVERRATEDYLFNNGFEF